MSDVPIDSPLVGSMACTVPPSVAINILPSRTTTSPTGRPSPIENSVRNSPRWSYVRIMPSSPRTNATGGDVSTATGPHVMRPGTGVLNTSLRFIIA